MRFYICKAVTAGSKQTFRTLQSWGFSQVVPSQVG
uniref:Uncharacterized protein n=1 Tax=Anguilla anguilla TaxID=7936 RepID=A0A0E9QU29_ANGAN